MSLVIFSVATIIDAFGVGLSFAFFIGAIIGSSPLIGLASSLFTIVGLVGEEGQRFDRV